MKRFWIISLLFLFSCATPKEQKIKEPEDLIPREKMVQVLADVHLLEASLSLRSVPQQQIRMHLPQEFAHDSTQSPVTPPGEKKDPLPYYDIFKSNQITKKQYEESMTWYASNPDKLNAIYDDVIVELTKRQASETARKK